MLSGLDLFSGIGGLTIALGDWVKPIAYCDNDPYSQAVLLSRMRDGSLPIAPIWDDVQTLSTDEIASTHTGGIDIIYGGFPCQDISVAGTGLGLDGERSGLFFEITRLVSELRPSFIFLENVPAITTRGLPDICLAITSLGYDCRWTIVSAAEVGACHIRERWFLLAYADGVQLREERGKENEWNSERKGSLEHNSPSSPGRIARAPEGKIKPRVVRTGDGVPDVVDRARCLGNAVHPKQAKKAFERLIGIYGP